ncbi:hypothetical protein HK104_001239 [Borealophlyctis nickersoniae]|nr:hypothetical protein HK104_001239 [Borealophlyctis nickersoniae]
MPNLTPALLLLLFSSLPFGVNSQANVTGNCVTGRINFDPNRVFKNPIAGGVAPPAPPIPSGSNVGNYDFSLDYGSAQFTQNGSIALQLVRQSGPAQGVRLSSTRYILYGRITARFSALAVPGAVTTFITMSDRKDEIDVEIVGGSSTSWTTNVSYAAVVGQGVKLGQVVSVFYKGIEEFGTHDSTEQYANGGTSGQTHEYTIDWRSDRLSWGINNQTVRTIYKENSTSPMTPAGERWFPSTPSLIQFSVWDGGSSTSEGTRTWAGGPINWGSNNVLTAVYDWIDIQCYDYDNNPVSAWPPIGTSNPARGTTLNQTQTTPNGTFVGSAGGTNVTSSGGPNIGVIAGGAVAGIVVLIAAVAGVVVVRRRRTGVKADDVPAASYGAIPPP